MIPQLRDWHARYEKQGLTIVGVHSPEFFWEKPYDKVIDATKKLGVRYPVVQDNDLATWNAYGNQYWPAEYFVDARGRVRFAHFGEGSYGEKEKVIRELLAEAGDLVPRLGLDVADVGKIERAIAISPSYAQGIYARAWTHALSGRPGPSATRSSSASEPT